jgi:hypothetical protein
MPDRAAPTEAELAAFATWAARHPRAGTMDGAAASGARAAEVTLALLPARS